MGSWFSFVVSVSHANAITTNGGKNPIKFNSHPRKSVGTRSPGMKTVQQNNHSQFLVMFDTCLV